MGQRSSPFPQASLAMLVQKKERLQDELRAVEKQVFDLETTYLQDSSHFGNVLRGFDGYLSKSSAHLKRSRRFQSEDRLFSLSSVTAPTAIAEELAASRGDGTTLDGITQATARNRAAGLPTLTAIAKQKRGRTAGPRDGKRIRPANEQQLEVEEVVELVPRHLV